MVIPMSDETFAVYILTHGRPDHVYTYKSLRRQGYTGRIIVLIDDEDSKAASYIEKYGDEVIQFCKSDVASRTDSADNFEGRKSGLYAWNAAFEISEEQGIKDFMLLDDDYTSWNYRIDKHFRFYPPMITIKNLDKLFAVCLEYYKSIPALSIALAQGGDFIGGQHNKRRLQPSRKVMNTFFCSTDRQFRFLGKLNGDMTTYATLGTRGGLFLTLKHAAIGQVATQATPGGMSETYKDSGTYVKSFYSVMYSPSCVKIAVMGDKKLRIHHNVLWKNAVPCIIQERHKK